MTRLYIAGPMTGLPEQNYPAFNDAAAKLRALGVEVVNPAENDKPPCGSWQGYMRMSIAQVSTVDAIVLLPGWEKSEGGRFEFNTAVGLKLQVMTLAEALDRFVMHHPV